MYVYSVLHSIEYKMGIIVGFNLEAGRLVVYEVTTHVKEGLDGSSRLFSGWLLAVDK